MRVSLPFVSPAQPSSAQGETVKSQNSPWLTPLVYCLGQHALVPFYFDHIEIVGQDNLPKSGPVILAPTHRSRWDAILIPFVAGRYVTGRDLRFMVTVDEMQGLQGWFIRHLGGFPVDPERPAIASLRHSLDLLAQGELLVIFPEGGHLSDNRRAHVNHLHPGLARLALQAESLHSGLNVKIIPINVQYFPNIPRWRCQVQVHIGEPIQAQTYLPEGIKKGAKHLISDLEQQLRRLELPHSLEQDIYEPGHPCREPIFSTPDP